MVDLPRTEPVSVLKECRDIVVFDDLSQKCAIYVITLQGLVRVAAGKDVPA